MYAFKFKFSLSQCCQYGNAFCAKSSERVRLRASCGTHLLEEKIKVNKKQLIAEGAKSQLEIFLQANERKYYYCCAANKKRLFKCQKTQTYKKAMRCNILYVLIVTAKMCLIKRAVLKNPKTSPSVRHAGQQDNRRNFKPINFKSQNNIVNHPKTDIFNHILAYGWSAYAQF